MSGEIDQPLCRLEYLYSLKFNSPKRHGDEHARRENPDKGGASNKFAGLSSPCLSVSVVNRLLPFIFPSPADDASDTRFSTDRAPHACTPASSKYQRGQELFAQCANPRRFRPYVWRNCGAAYGGWHDDQQRRPISYLPSARSFGA